MLVLGHRGAAGQVAENTLGSMRFALASGVNGVEFDVRMHDGRLIVLHDVTLDRTTNGRGPHARLSFAELRALKCANGERIPLLSEVLAVVANCEIVNVEIKEPGIAAAVIATLDSFVDDHGPRDKQLLLSSFDGATTAELARRRGDKRLGVLYEGDYDEALARATQLAAYSIHAPFEDVSAERVAAAHARGLKVFVYTVDAPAAIDQCRRAGVDAIFSDFPDRALAVLHQHGERTR